MRPKTWFYLDEKKNYEFLKTPSTFCIFDETLKVVSFFCLHVAIATMEVYFVPKVERSDGGKIITSDQSYITSEILFD